MFVTGTPLFLNIYFEQEDGVYTNTEKTVLSKYTSCSQCGCIALLHRKLIVILNASTDYEFSLTPENISQA